MRLELVEVHETVRTESHPDRVVYAITAAGREVARDWLREMLGTTGGEYPQFIAAVSVLFGLAPDDARAQLALRAERLAAELAETESVLSGHPGLPRLFLLEEDYRRAVLAAELAWVRGVVEDLRAGRLTWSEQWLREIAAAFTPPERDPGGRSMTPTIEAHRLEKHYGRTPALDGLDLIAERGQVVAVLGPNGAGKTTFVRAVATLLRLDGGTLRVAGHDVRRAPDAVRRVIGLAGQFAAVEPAMTARENLEMVAQLFGQDRREARAGAAAVLEQLGLVEDADRLARTYSGGMRRRLDLGASLVGAPRLLLLDEPTTGLDPRSRIELWDAIRALVDAGTDVLLTTQYLDEADHLASHVVIVDHGRAVAAGTPSELKRRVGRSVIEVHTRNGHDLARVADVLGRLDDDDVALDEATRRASVSVASGGEGLMAALRSVQAAGVEIEDIALRQPNLDEVFLALTGKPPAQTDERKAA